MAINKFLYRYQSAPVYIVLVLSICYFSVQLVLSHITHALTLLMASHHMLCNIFALGGYIMTIKHGEVEPTCILQAVHRPSTDDSNSTFYAKDSKQKAITINIMEEEEKRKLSRRERREMKLRNTFGWARIDILTMLIVCIILASLSFSLLVEALQTIVHIDHQDAMHLPIPVMILGFIGLVLNGLTYLLIGGYTIHQGSFLHVTPNGDVVLDRVSTNNEKVDTVKSNEHQLSESGSHEKIRKIELEQDGNRYFSPMRRQGAVEMLRDVSSSIFVIVCALIVYMAEDEEHTAKLIDPILSIFSCVLLVSLSYPYMKESCLILLQTIPGSIDMEIFEHTLLKKFPQIVNYHDLHIWQLSAHKSVATVHIKFQSPKIYIKIIDDVRSYFHDQGVTEVTIQPEFHCATVAPSLECLMPCSSPKCAEKVCCLGSRTDLKRASSDPNGCPEAIGKTPSLNISNEPEN